MAQWEGKSRGNVLGYKIFVFLFKTIGIGAAYFLLRFVAFYFVLFSPKGTKASYYYFHKRRGFSPLKSYFKVYQSYYKFGQTIIDKTAIGAGLRNKFTYEFDGVENIIELMKEQKGGIMISAHIGNFEMANYFFKEIDVDAQINLVTVNNERNELKEYLDSVGAGASVNLILIQEDMSHIFEIHNALARNELICFTGDRYFEGSKVLEEEFLGKSAKFPTGPFLLGSRMKVPVLFVYVMKETNKHYHLYARKAIAKARDPQSLLKEYNRSNEKMLEKYPLQWFNYFDFWEDKQS